VYKIFVVEEKPQKHHLANLQVYGSQVKVKVFPCVCQKRIRGIGVVAPVIRNLDITYRWVDNFMTWPHRSRWHLLNGRPSGPPRPAEWFAEQINLLHLPEFEPQFHGFPARSLATMLITIPEG
jgi:hypothetical protein